MSRYVASRLHARVAVPLEVQTAIFELGTVRKACAALGIGESSYRDAVAVNGMVTPQVLERIRMALARVTAQDARV